MVAAAMPVNAQDYELWPADSELNSQGTAHFMSFTDQHDNININSGDLVHWYNYWTNQYGGQYNIYSSYKYNSQSTRTDLLQGALKYHEAQDSTITIGAQESNLYRYHKYDSLLTIEPNLLTYLS
jgi:hypothetical protein